MLFEPRFRLLPLLLALPVLFTACGPSTPADNAPPPFVERIRPGDYAAAELLFESLYSRTHDIVFLRTDSGKPVSALTLKKETGGDYTATFITPPLEPGGEWLSISSNVSGPVGDQFARAVELKLHLRIRVAHVSRDVNRNDGDLWIFQKLSDNRTATALISLEATLDNPAATEFTDGLVGRLRHLVSADAAARAQILTEIDQIATRIIAESGKG